MHDPMAMRPFMGFNFGQYLQHWLDLEQPGRHMPKIFHVNWFRLSEQGGKFLWPGFGENIRVIDWMFKRCNGEDVAEPSPIGLLPKPGKSRQEPISVLLQKFNQNTELGRMCYRWVPLYSNMLDLKWRFI